MGERQHLNVSKAVAIVGASGGLGRAIAQRVAQRAAVTLGYFANKAAAEELATSIIDAGGKASTAQVDVTNGDSVEKFLVETEAHWGRLDSIILASGPKIPICPIFEVSDEVFRSVVETEVFGGFNIIKRGIPILRKQAAKNRSILFILTTAVLRTLAYDGCSAVPKMACLGLVRQTAREVAAEGIRVNAIGTGSFEAGMASGNHSTEALQNPYINSLVTNCRTPAQRSGDASEIAGVAEFLISEEASYVNGQILGVDGGHSS
ncbi:hypothetical protein A1O3_04438 [Capronia epimyces CBS 606.96]|uniref:3-oxoacyl-[acyl-carrier protein] reductase n=1 Tax=Capronia epimyces CBS 606.96 TaxID=1182542 RepID=W9Y4Q2_9EURO|nr:uncharacterized protein A1O3_04438 [Capronia epimyces CBS 606.96]EXJ87478.1 hypothetical protein A1O3_04438 [Capronia epimyces CBS 606.96]